MRIALIAAASIALAAPAHAATRNFGVQSFEKIRVEGPYSVSLKTGVAPFARASGSQSALDRLAIELRGTTLIVRAGIGSQSTSTATQGPIQIEIGTHDLTSATLVGAGSLAIDKARGLKFALSAEGSGLVQVAAMDVDQLNLALGGNASARLGGKAKSMTAVLRGLSTLDSSALEVKDATFGGDGPVSVRADVRNSAKVEGRGAANFTLAGAPTCTLRLQGSATATGCK